MEQKSRADSSVPAKWPGAFEAYKYSKKAVLRNLETLILIWLIIFVLNAIFNIPSIRNTNLSIINLVSLAVFVFILGAQVSTYLAGVNGKSLSIGQALNKGLSLWPKMLVMEIILSFIIVISLLLLVIPFFFVVPRLSLAFYFLVDKDMGVIDAIRSSWDSTRGYSASIWGIIGVIILMVLPVITIIGALLTIYLLFMYGAVFAVLYKTIGQTSPASSASAPTAPTENTSASV